jgi:hypothetical protein
MTIVCFRSALLWKDCQNRVLAGRDGTLGTLTNRLTSSFFGQNSAAIGAVGGNEKMPGLATLNLPPYTPAGTNSSSGVTVTSNVSNIDLGTGDASGPSGGRGVGSEGAVTSTGTAAAQTFTGADQGGTSTPFSIVQPTVTAECVVVVLP